MEKFEIWGIVDLFGHQKVGGRITEAQIGGCSFVRVDVPAVDGSMAASHLYGNGAIYQITPTSEEVVRLFVKNFKPAPLTIYIPEIRQIAEGKRENDPGGEHEVFGDRSGYED